MEYWRQVALVGSASRDRKSTRLNSSHLVISYAVFCLKKKKTLYISAAFPYNFIVIVCTYMSLTLSLVPLLLSQSSVTSLWASAISYMSTNSINAICHG